MFQRRLYLMKRRQFLLCAMALTHAFPSGVSAQENMDSEEVFPPPPVEKIVSAIEDLKTIAVQVASTQHENIFCAASEGIQDHYSRDEYESAGWVLHDFLKTAQADYGIGKAEAPYAALETIAAKLQAMSDSKSKAPDFAL